MHQLFLSKKFFFFVFCLFSFPYSLLASLPGDTVISADKILMGTFANDATFRTDYYFTQGISANLVHPSFRKLPVNKILIANKRRGLHYFGLKLSYDGFTPLLIEDPNLRYGDRPYAAYIYATQYTVQMNPIKKERLTAALDLGFMGPGAGTKGFQTQVHQWLDAPAPQGWDYQIKTDLVLGYTATYEKGLISRYKAAELIGLANASLGTLYTNAQTGLLLRTGKMNGYFQNIGIAARQNRINQQQFQFYAQGRLTGKLVGYNATLQGGVLNPNNVYTISGHDIKRTVLQKSAGLVGAYKGFSFESSVVWLSPEFKNGLSHKYMFFEVRFII